MSSTVARNIQPPLQTKNHVAILIAGYVAAYVALDWLSDVDPLRPLAITLAITPWNPPPGLSIALLLLCGLRFAPALFLAELAAEVTVRGFAAPLGYTILSSALNAAGYTALAAVLLRRVRFDPALRSVRDLSWFATCVAVATLLVTLAYISVYVVAGLIPRADIGRFFQRFWIGDAIGIMVTTPLALVLAAPRARAIMPYPRASEVAVFLASAALILWIIFGLRPAGGASTYYLLFLPLIWFSMRHGIQGATLANAAIQVGLIIAVQLAGLRVTTVLEFQFLMLALATTGLFLGMAVTERRRDGQRRREMEEQLRERQLELNHSLRLAAAGEMASALAHELNQPLSAIASYVRACRIMLSNPEGKRERIADTMDKVVSEVARAGEVVHRLRDFYRSGGVQLERVPLEDLVRRSAELSTLRAGRAGVVLRVDCPKGLPDIQVDRVQIEAVIHNLVSNSIDAISSGGEARREIRVRAEVVAPNTAQITVADSGPGVRADMADDLFRPFATSSAQGMGLGLAMSRSIAEAHGGKLENLRVDKGAAFRLTLPLGIPEREGDAAD